MGTKKSLVIAVGLVALLLVSGAVLFAQQDTSFDDGRINGDIYLGGLAIYCVDQSGQPGIENINDGGITIWGVGGKKYVDMSAGELRGQASLLGQVPVTSVTTTTTPLLLTTANTTGGPIWLFRTGDDQFTLQGTDTTGKFYSYQWKECSQGTLSTGGGPLLNVAATAQPSNTQEPPAFLATAQPTNAATQVATIAASPTALPTNAG